MIYLLDVMPPFFLDRPVYSHWSPVTKCVLHCTQTYIVTPIPSMQVCCTTNIRKLKNAYSAQ